jgi:PAS domain S-box-containing protein
MDVKTHLKILHLEDQPLDSELIGEILASEDIACEIVRVETRDDFEVALDESDFDLIFSDKTLPSFDGLAALALAREKRPDVPFIFVSGTLGEEVAIESLKNGATDYVVKQRLKRIVPVTRRALRETADHLERKKAEEALAYERHLLHFLMDTVPDSIYFKDTEGKFTLINRNLANDLGFEDPQEAVGKSDADFFSEALAAYSYSDEQEIMRTCMPIVGKEESEVWPDGHETWVLTTKMPLLDTEGRVVGTFGVSRDITERKQAEEAVARSESELRALFAAMRDVVLVLDAQGRYLQIAPTNPNLLYKPRAELLGRTIHEVMPSADADNILDHILLALEKQQPVHVEYRLPIGDNEIWFDGTVSPMGKDKVFWIARDVTERKRADESLRASEARYRALVEQAADGIFTARRTADQRTIVENVNSAGCEMFGYTREELVGLDVADLIADLDSPTDSSKIAAMLAGKALRSERLMLRKDGTTLAVETNTKMLDDGRIQSIARDITERKRAEESLRLSSEILQRVKSLVLVSDKDGQITYASPSVKTVLGYEPQDMLGDGWWQHSSVDLEEEKRERSHVIDLAAPETVVPEEPYERMVKGQAGELHWILWQDVKGPGDQVIGVGHDITERVEAEESLRESEERFRLMFANNPLPMWVYDIESLRFLEVNEAAVVRYGYSRDEFLSMHITDIRPREETPRLLKYLGESRPGLQDSGEWRHHTKGGQIIDVQITSHTFIFGGRNAALAVAQDITERKKAAEARLAREAAEQANRAKSEFLSRMSHELRTPLNSILGFSQLLQMGDLTPKQSQNLDYVLRGGEHLLNLINEVLDIARIESGHSSISLEPVEVREVLQECLDLMQPMSAQQGLKIEVGNSLEHVGFVLADRQRLRQVLLNIMTNAVKYNRDGGTVSLSSEAIGERLRIQVSDTGPGIPQSNVAKLFTPFERLGAEQTGIEGTGLGLALSKSLVEAMHGTIGVESTVGKGSTFWVDLAVAESPTEQMKKLLTGPLYVSSDPIKARTILYIEDNLSNLKLIEGILEQVQGIRLLTAMQGTLAIEMARHEQPDLILLDLHLPDMNGDIVLRRLKEDPRTSSIPVVMISADATPSQMERLRAAGAREYLTKPLSIKEFLRVLKEVFNENN